MYRHIPAVLSGGLWFLIWVGCAGHAERMERAQLDRERPVPSREGARPRAGDSSGDADWPDRPVLEDFLRHAALNHPGLEASFYRWKAALERVPEARALPDPKLTYSYYLQEVETRVGAQKHRLGLMQTIPWPSKLIRGTEAALREAMVKKHLYESEKLALFYKVKEAYYEYYYLARSIAIVQESLQLLGNMEAAIRTRYKAGAAGQPALLQVQVELGKLEDRQKSLEALQPAMAARLNAAVGRDPASPLPWLSKAPEEPPPLEEKALKSALMEKNPEVEAARERILATEAGKRLAKAQYLPDFGIGVGFIQTDRRSDADPHDNGKDPVLLNLEISLPLWHNRYGAAVRRAEAERAAAERDQKDLESRLAADLSAALYRYQDAGRKRNLFKDTLIPKAEQALKTTQSAFTSGKAGYLEMIETERQLLEFRLLAERALVDQSIRLAELEKLCGRGLREGPVSE